MLKKFRIFIEQFNSMNLFDSFQREQTTLSKRNFCKNAYLPKEDFMQFSLNDIDNITVSEFY